jgi:hypothetical protein
LVHLFSLALLLLPLFLMQELSEEMGEDGQVGSLRGTHPDTPAGRP